MNFILAIDIGTSGVKAVGVTPSGEVITSFSQSYESTFDGLDRAEQDPEVIFSAVCQVIASAIRETAKEKLEGISFSSAMHSIMAVDHEGLPLTKLLTWADLRSTTEASKLRTSEDGKVLYHATGTPVHPMSPLCKLIWWRKNEPGLLKRAWKFIGIKEYILFRIFSDWWIDHSIASATGLFNTSKINWHAHSLKIAGISEGQLPQCVPTKYIIRKKPNLQLIPDGIPVVIGASDGCLAQLGSNAMDPSSLSVTIGTSCAARRVEKNYQADPKGRVFRYLLDENTVITGGASNNGLSVFQWFEKEILKTKIDLNNLSNEIAKIQPGSDGCLFLPYLLGERAPDYDAEARGAFTGLSNRHTSAHLLRSMAEGICFALKSIADALEETSGPYTKLIASGGFIHCKNWLQLLANVIGKDVYVNHLQDASALGAAIIGFHALGIPYNHYDPKTMEVYQANDKENKFYTHLFDNFQRVNRAMVQSRAG